MRQLRITEAFAKYGAKLRNQKWSYPAFAEDNSLVLCCWQRYLTKNPDGSYRYEVNDFAEWTANPLGKALLVDHLKRAIDGNLRIPSQSGHRFRRKAATDSDRIRPPIPRQAGHSIDRISRS